MHIPVSFRRALASAAALSVMSVILQNNANADERIPEQEVLFAIPSAPLADALRQFGAQSGAPILFSETLVAGTRTAGLSGTYLPKDALWHLLDGTGLEAVEGAQGALVVRARQEESRESTRSPATIERVGQPEAPQPDDEIGKDAEAVLRAESVIVTGTSLRGMAPESSPLQVFGRDEVLGSGVTSVEQFIRALPQNFGGGSTEFTAIGLPNDSNSRANNTSGASANLRGLGSRGTLVLINGNRMAPTSEIGDFVDLSLIPMSAIERVEVLTDGASSIYGGDAVAGVINFILRDDFEGAETAIRYGAVTDGDLKEVRVSQTAGTAWEGGNLLGTYEFFSRDNLTLADRPEIGLFDPRVTGTVLPERRLFDLLPGQERHSAVLSANQQLTGKLAVSASGLYSKRETERTRFAQNAGIDTYDIESEGLTLAFGADYEISPSWAASLDLTYGRIRNRQARYVIEGGFPRETPAEDVDTRSDLWSLDLKLDGDLFRLPGGMVKSAIGGHLRREEFSNEILGQRITSEGNRDVSAIYAEAQIPLIGPDNAVPAIRRLELNLSGRMEDYSDFGTSSNPKIGLLWSPAEGINLRSSYSTSFAPPALGRAFALGLTGQVLPYDFMLGFIGLQAPDPALNGTGYLQVLGTAKDLDPETSRTFTSGLDARWSNWGHNWALSATYYDIEFEGRLGSTPIPLGQSDIAAPNIAYEDPGAFPPGSVIFFPTQQQVDDLVASFDIPVGLYLGATLDNVGIINNVNLVRNLARTETNGLDLQLDYETETRLGRVSAGINANYIIGFTQQAATTTPAVDTLNTYLNPVDLQLRGHAGLSRGRVTANAFVNYVDAYHVDHTQGAAAIPSWTTVDLVLSYSYGSEASGWRKGLDFNLGVTNLFNEAPPAAPSNGAYGMTAFDPTNASPLGRFVSFEVRKAF